MSYEVRRRAPQELAPLRALEKQWCETFASFGMRSSFDNDCFVAWDGAGTVLLAAREEYDADDTVAQLIFHEFCHWLVEGRAAYSQFDWGLSNEDDRHLANEHAALRLQALFNDRFALREWLYPTTPHLEAYRRLGSEPLTDPMEPALDAESQRLARRALQELEAWPEWPKVEALLASSARALGL